MLMGEEEEEGVKREADRSLSETPFDRWLLNLGILRWQIL